MSKIDGQNINRYIEHAISKKPPMIAVDDKEWENALRSYGEILWEGVTEETTTQEFWTLIYFCAMSFCRGMEYAEVKAGIRTETYYPRY